MKLRKWMEELLMQRKPMPRGKRRKVGGEIEKRKYEQCSGTPKGKLLWGYLKRSHRGPKSKARDSQ